MKICVLIKQVPDTETKIRLLSDKSNIEKGDIKWIINPYDEFAIEEALKTKEKLQQGSVTVITAGPDRSTEALRTALAMGADNAIHIKLNAEIEDTFLVGQALAEALKKESPQIVFSGKQAIDDDQAATFGYVAEFLNWPLVSVVTKVEVGNSAVKVEREVEGGLKHVIEMPLPCLIAVHKGINTPRYASLPGIMKAKKKEILGFTLADLGIAESPTVKALDYELPPERKPGKKLSGDIPSQVKELVRLLREEAKVL